MENRMELVKEEDRGNEVWHLEEAMKMLQMAKDKNWDFIFSLVEQNPEDENKLRISHTGSIKPSELAMVIDSLIRLLPDVVLADSVPEQEEEDDRGSYFQSSSEPPNGLFAPFVELIEKELGIKPPANTFPSVKFLSEPEYSIEANGGNILNMLSRKVYGFYRRLDKTIYLPFEWKEDNIFDQSVFLHELTHWVQDVDPEAYVLENQAYHIQFKFMHEHGFDPTTKFGYQTVEDWRRILDTHHRVFHKDCYEYQDDIIRIALPEQHFCEEHPEFKGYINFSESSLAKLLREAKEAHTRWEHSFLSQCNPIPKHNWEDWYARFIRKTVLEWEAYNEAS